jgi:6-pyruvoyltetrahydropterin/6-carboxytetrahydropterin synthase
MVMSTLRITKEFRFEAAHALKDYDGPCKSIHGHSYELSVTVRGIPIQHPTSHKKGMIMDFGDLKKIVKRNIIDRFDHSLILQSNESGETYRNLGEEFSNVILVDYQPTSENLLIDIAQKITGLLPEGVTLHSLKLRETANSYAEWFADDNR